jgi:nucleotide-binding universal stress UspA family protein
METVNFKKIMIATDGLDCTRMVAEKRIELARLSGETVYAVCVVSCKILDDNEGMNISLAPKYLNF